VWSIFIHNYLIDIVTVWLNYIWIYSFYWQYNRSIYI